jgi:sugar phosphate isomerase/epimerase
MGKECMSGSRREFLKISGAAAVAACAGVRGWAARVNLPIGLQLYSVRELLPKDFDGTLKQLRGMDYRVVEAAGYYNKAAAEWKKAMEDARLRCISSHHVLADLKSKLDELIDYGHAIGLEYMICSWAGMHRDPAKKGELNLDDWRWVADQFNEIGQKVKAAGMQFGYHNHTIEFRTEDSVLYYDELLKRTDPKYVIFEMDCGWVVAAGRNPVEWLSKTPERFPLLHVKDMAKGAGGEWHSVVLDTGVIDYHPIFKAATGLKQYFIEQEEFKGDPLSELHQDAEYMANFSI